MNLVRLLPVPAAVLAAGAVATIAFAQGEPAYSGTAVKTVTSTLRDGTGADLGIVQLSQDANGVVQLLVDASKLPTGAHGIHLHATGSCEGPAFATAGGHFNPGAKKHGLASTDGPHAGDLPQVDTVTVKLGYYGSTTNRVSITGGAASIFDADGTALVVHATADDQLTDPTGNSGARIACAVLAAPNPALAIPAVAPSVAPLPPKTGTGLAGDSSWGMLGLFALAAALLTAGAQVVIGRRR